MTADSSEEQAVARPVQPISTYRQIGALYRRHAVILLILGVVILTPLALVEVLTRDVGTIDTDEGLLLSLSNLVVVALRSASTLFGEIFYSGAVALLVLHSHESSKLLLRDVYRKLPFGRLVALDFLYTGIVFVGVVLLIVPGLIFMTWFWLSGAIVEVEGRRPIAALRRSRNLVRGSFWPTFAVVIPLTLGTSFLSGLGAHLTVDVLGHSMVGEWLTEAIWDVLVTPLYALGVIVVLVRLSGRRID